MAFFQVDAGRCGRDGICAAVCPAGLLVQMDDTLPVPIPGAEDICFDCGACQAACPHGAITLSGRSPDALDQVKKELAVTPEQMVQLVRSRRSVRSFKDEPVSRELLAEILDTVRFAPTGMNAQTVKWLAVDDRAKLHEIGALTARWMKENGVLTEFADIFEAGQDVILRGAPCLALAYDKSQGFEGGLVDCVIAATHLDLAMRAYGLGGTWAGLVMLAGADPRMAALLELPEGHRVWAALMLGKPKIKYARIPERKPLSLHWL